MVIIIIVLCKTSQGVYISVATMWAGEASALLKISGILN